MRVGPARDDSIRSSGHFKQSRATITLEEEKNMQQGLGYCQNARPRLSGPGYLGERVFRASSNFARGIILSATTLNSRTHQIISK